MKNEMTITAKFDALINAVVENGISIEGFDVVEFLEDRKAKSLSKKSSKTPEQIAENDKIKATIMTILEDKEMQNKDITKFVNKELEAEYSANKISRMIQEMIADNKVVRTEVKKVAYFSLA